MSGCTANPFGRFGCRGDDITSFLLSGIPIKALSTHGQLGVLYCTISAGTATATASSIDCALVAVDPLSAPLPPHPHPHPHPHTLSALISVSGYISIPEYLLLSSHSRRTRAWICRPPPHRTSHLVRASWLLKLPLVPRQTVKPSAVHENTVNYSS